MIALRRTSNAHQHQGHRTVWTRNIGSTIIPYFFFFFPPPFFFPPFFFPPPLRNMSSKTCSGNVRSTRNSSIFVLSSPSAGMKTDAPFSPDNHSGDNQEEGSNVTNSYMIVILHSTSNYPSLLTKWWCSRRRIEGGGKRRSLETV